MEEEDELKGGLTERLKRQWRNERCSPTLLPHVQELIEELKLALGAQKENIEMNRQQFQDSMSKMMLDAMELECGRIEFFLHSYHRTRLQKIQKLCFYLLATEEAFECMTENEQTYCQGFANLTQRHFEQSFLKGLPATLRRIDKVEMFVKPDLHTPVFIKVIEDVEGLVNMDDDEVDMKKGDIKVVEYKHVERLLLDDKVELI